MVNWDFSNLIKARKIIDPIWKSSLLKGRCWGDKDDKNPFARSNITIAAEINGQVEIVSISQTKDGKLKIHEFRKAEGTSLGSEVKELFIKSGLAIEEKPRHQVKIFIGNNRGPYGSFPVYRGILWILRDRSDELVPLEEIVKNESLKRSCTTIGQYMWRDIPDERNAAKVVKRAIAYLRRKGHEIACVRDDLGRLCYCCAEVPTDWDREMTVEAKVTD